MTAELSLVNQRAAGDARRVYEGAYSSATEASDGALRSDDDRVSVSSLGRQVNDFYYILSTDADPGARSEAIKGLNSLVSEFVQDEGMRQSGLVGDLARVQRDNPGYFRNFFRLAGQMSESGPPPSSLTNAFAATSDPGVQQLFIKEAVNIGLTQNSGDETQETFSGFLSVTRMIGERAPGADARNFAHSGLFGGLEQAQGLASKQAFIESVKSAI